MPYVDFEWVKRLASLRDVARWLFGNELKSGRNGNEDRCQCPVGEGDGRDLVLTYDREPESWTCFSCKSKYPHKRNSGDTIALVAHVNEYPEHAKGYQQAAQHIVKRFHGYEPTKKGLPEGGLDYLQPDHETVQAFGISPHRAEELGIGYAPRGTMIHRVLFPLRDKNGTLLGYVGISPGADIRLPKSLVQ